MRSALDWTILRPGFFAENLIGAYRSDIWAGRVFVPAGDGRVAFVAGRDLGAVAALALLDPADHAGRAYHLTGPHALGFTDVAGLLSAALGRPASTLEAFIAEHLGVWAPP